MAFCPAGHWQIAGDIVFWWAIDGPIAILKSHIVVGPPIGLLVGHWHFVQPALLVVHQRCSFSGGPIAILKSHITVGAPIGLLVGHQRCSIFWWANGGARAK